LLGKLDEWLHQPPRRQTVDVAEILRPYRDQAALNEVVPDDAVLGRALVEEASP